MTDQIVNGILSRATLDGLILKLPEGQLDRKTYEAVAKRIQGIGGKWKGGKTAGFVFTVDPRERFEALLAGENVNLKKDFQFFATSDEYADWMTIRAGVEPYHKILEPSAGDGALVNAIRWRYPEIIVDCFELMPENRAKLADVPGARLIGEDFLAHLAVPEYDRIIANPPFSKNQDIAHIRHMWDCLKPDGLLITVASAHWTLTDQRLHREFRDWLSDIGANIEDVPRDTFKASGTSYAAKLIVAGKK